METDAKVKYRPLEELAELPDNWDSYGGVAPSPETIDRVRAFLSVVVPSGDVRFVATSEGGIQVEMHHSGVDVEIYFHGKREDDDGLVVERVEVAENAT